jgi:hypothetical protein
MTSMRMDGTLPLTVFAHKENPRAIRHSDSIARQAVQAVRLDRMPGIAYDYELSADQATRLEARHFTGAVQTGQTAGDLHET